MRLLKVTQESCCFVTLQAELASQFGFKGPLFQESVFLTEETIKYML